MIQGKCEIHSCEDRACACRWRADMFSLEACGAMCCCSACDGEHT